MCEGKKMYPPARTRHVFAWPTTWKVTADVLPMRPNEQRLTRRARKHVPSTRPSTCCFSESPPKTAAWKYSDAE